MNKLIKSTDLTRRHTLALGGAALATPFLASTALGASEFRILAWEGYADDTWVKEFEKTNGVSTNIVYVGSVDEMFAKMQGSKGADFDVVSFDTSAFDRYLSADLLQPIDLSKVPNAANIMPSFSNVEAIIRDGEQYGAPFTWGSLAMIYDKDAFSAPPESWEVMWDPAHTQQLIALDDANNSIVLAAMVLGLPDPFNLSDAEFDLVKAKLIAQKQVLLTYYAGFDEGVSIFANSGVKAMFSMGEAQLQPLIDKGVNAALHIPKEGAIGWLDCWTISKGAQDVDLAHAWIDVCLKNSVGQHLTEAYGYGNATDPAVNEAANMTYSDQLVWLATPEDFEKRVAVWNEVKAAS